MDYERILKPSSQGGGGFSPSKLRAMLLGVEKRRNEDPDPAPCEIDDDGEDECKDVGVVPSSSSSSSAASAAPFEFQKSRSGLMPPFSKPAPSKWDDAQKWILSPAASRKPQPKKPPPAPASAKPVADPEIRFSQHDPSTSHPAAMGFIAPPSTVRAVSMRDMGTEMTPIASQEPSRTGTPARSTTPAAGSPSSSRPSTPPRVSAPVSAAVECGGDRELTEKELQRKTRQEIMVLGTRLGKANIAAWASKEEENGASEQQARGVVEAHAVAWEEAERAKYMARFKEEEVKIEAWENHQKAKAEAEMREIEVKLERMKTRAQDRLMNKLASIRHKSEKKLAAAEAERNRQAARTAQQADYIRRTGHIPSSFTCWIWCP